MRLPQFRFTRRKTKFAIFACVVIVWMIIGELRRVRFREAWERHAALAQQYETFHYTGPGGQDYVRRFEHNHRLWRYHDNLASKYELATWVPWIPYPSDPPEPN